MPRKASLKPLTKQITNIYILIMKRTCLTLLLLCTTLLTFATTKPKVMWLDCSANFERFSYPDSIRYYVGKCHEAGVTHLVLDIKDNTG